MYITAGSYWLVVSILYHVSMYIM